MVHSFRAGKRVVWGCLFLDIFCSVSLMMIGYSGTDWFAQDVLVLTGTIAVGYNR